MQQNIEEFKISKTIYTRSTVTIQIAKYHNIKNKSVNKTSCDIEKIWQYFKTF
jgi:hypothetical protein